MEIDWIGAAIGFTHLLLAMLVLVAAKFLKGWMTPYSIDREMSVRDNPALGLAIAGYYGGVLIVYIAAAAGDPLPHDLGSRELLLALGHDALWAFAGMLALNAARWSSERLLLPRLSNVKEIVEDRNLALGAAECGVFLGTALVVAAAIQERGGGVLTVAIFFLLAQILLVAFERLYTVLARYDVQGEIEKDNTAAGVAFGLSIVALSILQMKALSGDFIDLATNVPVFLRDSAIGFVLLMLMRLVTDLLLLPGATIRGEICNDRNVNAGLLEGVIAIGSAGVIYFLL